MTGVYPTSNTYLGWCFSLARDMWAHPQQHRWLVQQQAASKGGGHGTTHTRALQTLFADPLGGAARNANINEINYIEASLILLMLAIRGVINVAQFWVLAVVKFWRAISLETARRRRRLSPTTRERQPDSGRGRRSRQLLGLVQNTFSNSLLLFHRSVEV